MPGTVHITLNYVHTLCRRPVGELAGDTYTTDIIRATSPATGTCPECLERLGDPRSVSDVITESERAYEVGYTHGKDKAYFEMDTWDPRNHDVKTGCGCRPCVTARTIMRKMLGGVDDGRAR